MSHTRGQHILECLKHELKHVHRFYQVQTQFVRILLLTVIAGRIKMFLQTTICHKFIHQQLMIMIREVSKQCKQIRRMQPIKQFHLQ
jgi:hypothetical protein